MPQCTQDKAIDDVDRNNLPRTILMIWSHTYSHFNDLESHLLKQVKP